MTVIDRLSSLLIDLNHSYQARQLSSLIEYFAPATKCGWMNYPSSPSPTAVGEPLATAASFAGSPDAYVLTRMCQHVNAHWLGEHATMFRKRSAEPIPGVIRSDLCMQLSSRVAEVTLHPDF